MSRTNRLAILAVLALIGPVPSGISYDDPTGPRKRNPKRAKYADMRKLVGNATDPLPPKTDSVESKEQK